MSAKTKKLETTNYALQFAEEHIAWLSEELAVTTARANDLASKVINLLDLYTNE